MNTDGPIEVAKMRAKKYADSKTGNNPYLPEWAHIYNAHLDGLIECLSERMALRQMLEKRKPKTNELDVESFI